MWPVPFSQRMELNVLRSNWNSIFPKPQSAICTAMRALSVSSSCLRLAPAHSGVHARPMYFKSRCSCSSSLLQPTEKQSRQYLLPHWQSHAKAKGPDRPLTLLLLPVPHVFLISSKSCPKRYLFLFLQCRQQYVPHFCCFYSFRAA